VGVADQVGAAVRAGVALVAPCVRYPSDGAPVGALYGHMPGRSLELALAGVAAQERPHALPLRSSSHRSPLALSSDPADYVRTADRYSAACRATKGDADGRTGAGPAGGRVLELGLPNDRRATGTDHAPGRASRYIRGTKSYGARHPRRTRFPQGGSRPGGIRSGGGDHPPSLPVIPKHHVLRDYPAWHPDTGRGRTGDVDPALFTDLLGGY
jgi:hypothetical protein